MGAALFLAAHRRGQVPDFQAARRAGRRIGPAQLCLTLRYFPPTIQIKLNNAVSHGRSKFAILGRPFYAY